MLAALSFFGKKNREIVKVQVACPYCGAAQPEPPLAMSTFCRSCGEHYRIEGGRGLGREGPNVSGLIRTMPKPPPPAENEPSAPPPAPDTGSSGPDQNQKGRLLPAWLKRPDTGPARVVTNSQGDVIKRPATPHEPEKKQVRCFECNHRQWVPIAAESTQCGRCSIYISLGDFVIRTPSSQNIRTRGDVVVEKKGSLIGCDIACHNLTVMGEISGSVDCSGVAHFKHSSKVIGSMHCKHLLVEKRCEVIFPQGLMAEEADVYGTLIGNVLCSGVIRIYPSGSVIGDATAKSIVMKDGGVLTGRMSIRQDLDITLPTKKRLTGRGSHMADQAEAEEPS